MKFGRKDVAYFRRMRSLSSLEGRCALRKKLMNIPRLLLFGLLLLLVISFEPQVARADEVLLARMISPKYRNAIYPTMEKPQAIKIRIQINLAPEDLAAATLQAQLGRDSNLIRAWEFSDLVGEDVLVLDVGDLDFAYTRSGPYVKDDNPYEIRLELFSRSASLDVEILPLHKYPPPPEGVHEVRIDDDDNIVMDGERTFIFAVYPGSFTDPDIRENLAYLEGLGFMAFFEYGSTLDLDVHSDDSLACLIMTEGVMENDPETTRGNIVNYRTHPQVLAYLLADEPNTHPDHGTPEVLQEHYRIAAQEDPYHPVYNTMTVKAAHRYCPVNEYTQSQDIILLDPYPCREDRWPSDLYRVYQNYVTLHSPELGYSAFEHMDIPAAAIPQMHNYTPWRMPHIHEQKNMVYQHIIGGAKWIMPYSYSSYQEEHLDEWEYYSSEIIPELQAIQDAVFAPMGNGVTIHSSNPERLVYRMTETPDYEYVFLANTTGRWNTGMDFEPAHLDEVITIDVTFSQPGKDYAEVIVGDPSMPASFSLVDYAMTLELDGVNENSTGVLVLRREKTAFESMDINMDGSVNVLDVQLWVNVSVGEETNPIFVERADVNNDDKIDEMDLQFVLNRILTR